MVLVMQATTMMMTMILSNTANVVLVLFGCQTFRGAVS